MAKILYTGIDESSTKAFFCDLQIQQKTCHDVSCKY